MRWTKEALLRKRAKLQRDQRDSGWASFVTAIKTACDGETATKAVTAHLREFRNVSPNPHPSRPPAPPPRAHAAPLPRPY